MVLNILGVVAAAIVALYVVATIVRLAGFGGLATLLVQEVVVGGGAYALLSISFISLPVAVAVALIPIGVRLFAYWWFYRQGKKVLAGDYGEEARWAAELVESDDDKFIEASAHLNQVQMREAGIIADDKQELREHVIEQYEEMKE